MSQDISVYTIRRFKWFKFNRFLLITLSPIVVFLGVYSLKELLFTLGIPIPFLLIFVGFVVLPQILKDVGSIDHLVVPETVVLYANVRKSEVQ